MSRSRSGLKQGMHSPPVLSAVTGKISAPHFEQGTFCVAFGMESWRPFIALTTESTDEQLAQVRRFQMDVIAAHSVPRLVRRYLRNATVMMVLLSKAKVYARPSEDA